MRARCAAHDTLGTRACSVHKDDGLLQALRHPERNAHAAEQVGPAVLPLEGLHGVWTLAGPRTLALRHSCAGHPSSCTAAHCDRPLPHATAPSLSRERLCPAALVCLDAQQPSASGANRDGPDTRRNNSCRLQCSAGARLHHDVIVVSCWGPAAGTAIDPAARGKQDPSRRALLIHGDCHLRR